jgi:hypothetical protein
MSLLNTAAAFIPPVNLASWRQAMDTDSRWKLILRNFERECDRQDIEPLTWEHFLRDLETEWNVLAAVTKGLISPVQAIDNVIARNWQTFMPSGKQVAESDDTVLSKYMRLDKFWLYNLKNLALSGQSSKLANEIAAGNLKPADITGDIGDSKRPGWCTKQSSIGSTADANRIRDLVGLKHIDGDWLLEVSFPFSHLHLQNIALQAPTVIDSVAAGAENWIFSKLQGTAGPDWGLTVDMEGGGACDPGVPEAVHRPFRPTLAPGISINLRVIGEVTTSSPSVDYAALLANAAI